MAKKSTKKTSETPEVIDAEIVENTVEEITDTGADLVESTEDAAADLADDTAESSDLDPIETVETPELDTEFADDPIAEPEVLADPEPVTETPPAPPPPPAQPQSSGAGFVPLLLGGVFAGLIGYGVATYGRGGPDDSLMQSVSANGDAISALRDELQALPPPIDLSGLESQLADIATEQSVQNEAVTGQIAELFERLDVLEKQPSADGTLQEAAIAAYERDLEELRSRLEGQQSDLQAMIAATADQIDETRAEAQAIEANAVAAAKQAMAQSALARVQGALESGAPMGAVLDELSEALGGALPDALTAVADGAPTLASLQADFPDAARAALATARAEGASGEEAGGLTSFLKSQFNVRSVTPQEGDGADAVLSRAEAALREGRLNDTMAEIAALPEVARGALSDWLATAERRAAAVDAATTLSAEIQNDN